MARISASDARKNFSETLNKVAYAGERVVLHRRDRDIAAIISMDDLALLQDLEDHLESVETMRRLQDPGETPVAYHPQRGEEFPS